MDFLQGSTLLALAPYLWLAVIAAAAISAPAEKHFVWFALAAAVSFVLSDFGVAFRWQTVTFLAVSALCVPYSYNKPNKHKIKGRLRNEKRSDNNGQ